MKQLIQLTLLVICSFSIFTSSQAQPGWVAQTSGTTLNLNALHFVSSSTGFIVGNSGTILKTTNSGTNWSALVSGVPTHLFGVYFVNASTGFAVGDVGTVLKTTNSGANWVTQNSTVPYHLDGIYFANASTGIVVGWYGTVIRTTNGGSSWSQVAVSTTNDLNALSFYDANNGTATGLSGTVFKTSNGGVNWVSQSSGTSVNLESVCYMNGSTAIIVGEAGNIRKTTNSGINWNNQSSGTSIVLSGVHFINTNNGVYVGENGTIRRTSNSGSGWIAQTSNTTNWLRKVYMLDSLNYYAVGDAGTIRRTTTGGWLLPAQPSLSAPANNLTCVSLTPAIDWNDVAAPVATYTLQIGINANFDTLALNVSGLTASAHTVAANILNYNKLYHWRVKATNSVGEGSWSASRTFTTKNQPPALVELSAPANNATGVALTPLLNWGDAVSTLSYRVQVASDTAFTNIIVDSSGVSLSQFTVPAGRLDNNTAYYWRVNGTNACESSAWTARWKFTTTVELPIAPVLVSPPNGTVGLSLTPALDWLDIASAETYRIIISTDSAFTAPVLDTAGITASNFNIPDTVLSSFTWYYWKVSASNEAGSGSWSAEWKFQTTFITGLTQSNNIIPSLFALSQNYPNPFNPVTRIEFALPQKADVKLNIYSQSGERTAVLVNNSLSAGTYSYSFDGSKLPSGIYYYRIEAGDFIQTKRMVLIK